MNYASMKIINQIINHKRLEAPVVNVGIMTEKAVSFVFHGEYVHTETGTFLIGEQRAFWVNGKIVYNGRLFKEIFFEPACPFLVFRIEGSHHRP